MLKTDRLIEIKRNIKIFETNHPQTCYTKKFIFLVVNCYKIYTLFVKPVTVFYNFYDFFCRWHSLMNRPCNNILFNFMQHDNFWKLNRVIFNPSKHIESRVNVFWCCFPVIKRYTFYYLMKSAPIPGNQNSVEIL